MKNFNPGEAVEYLQGLGITFTQQTMSVWRCLGRGPRFKKIGSKVYYEKGALDEFAKGRTVETRDSKPNAGQEIRRAL